jgi:Na+/H+ antiporter NhaD/arsenite permease-like protein
VQRFVWLKKARSYFLPGVMLLGGVVVLGVGALPLPEFAGLADRTVPVLAFVLAMSLLTELLEEAGLFKVVTDRLAGLGRGRVFGLWLLVVALATVATVFLSLDTTAVLVTPVVVLLAVHAGIPPLPFAMTSIWLANTASLLLPVSNLTNLLAQDKLALNPLGFAGIVWAPALVGVAVPLILLWLAFRKELRGRYAAQRAQPVRDRPLLIFAAATLLVLLPALVSGLPVQYPAMAAAVFLLAVFLRRRPAVLRWSMVPWRPLMLTVGLFMVMEALHAHGLTPLLAAAAGEGEGLPALLQLAALGAGAANAVNNLPAYLALEPVAGSPARLAALLIGVNLGPLVTPWASLATLLWHERLRVLNVPIRWSGFALAGLLATLFTVPLAVVTLWVTSGMQ